ncbi:MAG: SMC-Scp complex subunit ScpB [Hyphomicrobium sp.]|jgi:segregation and condensation protein B
MVPPRLTLVARNAHINDNTPRSDPEGASGSEIAPTISEVEAAAAGFLGSHQERREKLRVLEAMLFATSEPLDEAVLQAQLGGGEKVAELLAELQESYAGRGVNLVRVAGKWAFRTAGDLSYLLEKHASEERRLSRAALETLAIISYHQPVTRAEIEDIRGVTTSAGTLDILMEAGWVRPRGRRRAPGKPLTYGTTERFLSHFGLNSVKDLPGLADLKAAGLLDGHLPPGFAVPDPLSVAALMPDELPLEAGDEGRHDGETDDAEGDAPEEAAVDPSFDSGLLGGSEGGNPDESGE